MGTILLTWLLCRRHRASVFTGPKTAPGRASGDPVRVGEAAFGDWCGASPDIAREITADALPAPFASEYASRRQRTGCEVECLRFRDGHPAGVYRDFMTGLVLSDNTVCGGRPGRTLMHNGSLLVSGDGNGTICRNAY